MAKWIIEATPQGTFDVFRDRRPVAYDRDDMDEALRCVQWHPDWDPRSDSIEVEDLDGYRSPVRL